MDIHEFLAVRIYFNRIRKVLAQEQSSKEAKLKPLSFEEYALLAHIYEANELPTFSDLAAYQKASKATITQRITHLQKFAFVTCQEDCHDKRKKFVSVTRTGIKELKHLGMLLSGQATPGVPLYCSAPERMTKYADTVGSFPTSNKELVLLILGSMRKTDFSLIQISHFASLSIPTTKNVLKGLLKAGALTTTLDHQELKKEALKEKQEKNQALKEREEEKLKQNTRKMKEQKEATGKAPTKEWQDIKEREASALPLISGHSSLGKEEFRLTIKGKSLVKQAINGISSLRVRRTRKPTSG